MTAVSGSLQEHGKGSVVGCKSKTLFCLLTYLSGKEWKGNVYLTSRRGALRDPMNGSMENVLQKH